MSAVHSIITTVTHNIPSFLREPAVALIGERCYTILIYDFNITHADCFKFAISKGLGLGIVVGGSIVKIPQIIKIISTQSARGLSLPAYVLETVSYAISLAYASRAGFPFSTYGENFFITIQNVIITLLILYLSTPKRSSSRYSADKPLNGTGGRNGASVGRVTVGAVAFALLGAFLWTESLCPQSTLSLLQAATIPLSLSSKAPQIFENYSNRSTGNLSAFAIFSALLGCLARLFTTRQEVNDPLIFWGFAGAAVLNTILALQMILYWKKSHPVAMAGSHEDVPLVAKRSMAEQSVVESPIKIGIQDGGDVGKRWSRKLD